MRSPTSCSPISPTASRAGCCGFPAWQQALHVLPLLLLSQVLMVLVRLLAGAEFPGWAYFLSSFSSALLWMPLSLLLLLPQLQPVERDDNRPI